jgi:glycine cleavage system aminomethyltransferase T
LPAVEATTPTIRKTALNAVHRQMGAKMVEFNGWDMPVEYPSAGGIMAEHNAVRTGVGIFDVSHMGDIRLAFGGRAAYLDERRLASCHRAGAVFGASLSGRNICG